METTTSTTETQKVECLCGEHISRSNLSKHKKTSAHATNLAFKRIVDSSPASGDLFTAELKAMLLVIANVAHSRRNTEKEINDYRKFVVEMKTEIERLMLLKAANLSSSAEPNTVEYWIEQLMLAKTFEEA